MRPIVIPDNDFEQLIIDGEIETNQIKLYGDPDLFIGSTILVGNQSGTKQTKATIKSAVNIPSIPNNKHLAYRILLENKK